MAFPIANLPTDNLYKFMTVIGIIIAVGSYLALQESEKQGNEQDVLALEAANKVKAEQDYESRQVEALAAEVKNTIAQLNSLPKNSSPEFKPLVEQYRKTLQEEESKLEEVSKLEEGTQLDIAVGKALLKRLENARDDLKWVLYMFNVGSIFGYLMTFGGFGLWYYNLQRHIDAQVKRDSGISANLLSQKRRRRQEMLGRQHRL